MFNISKQGSSLLITSNDNSQFPWKDGQMSLPMNSVVYVIDESDYIAFRSASNNDILFTALIDEIQINGTNVTKDDFILQFDNVANSAGGGGGSASAGVNSINGFQGDLTLKTVNGNSLIGSGNIEISGEGGTAGVEAINIGQDIQDWTQKTGIVKLYTQMYDGGYEVAADGMSFFGIKPIDDSIIIENAGFTANGCFRGGIKVNPDILGGGEPEQYVKNVTTDNVGSIYINNSDGTSDRIVFPLINGQNLVGNGGNIEISGGELVEETDPVFTEWKESGSIAIGENNTSEAASINIGQNNENATAYSILIGQYVTATTGTSPIIIGSDAQSHNDEEILLGIAPLSRTGSSDAERTHIAFSKFKSDPSRSSNCFEIRNDNSVYIWDSNNTEMIKLQDYLSKEWTGTQAEYDALGTYDDNTTYNIIEG